MVETTDLTIFTKVFNRFQQQYPRRGLRLDGTIVEIDGKHKFNIEGYNLLYNLQRLTKCLEDELL